MNFAQGHGEIETVKRDRRAKLFNEAANRNCVIHTIDATPRGRLRSESKCLRQRDSVEFVFARFATNESRFNF